jgi:hypothetical protein
MPWPNGVSSSGERFRYFADRHGRDFLLLETSRWSETLRFLKRKKITAVAVSRANGYGADSLDHLREIPSLEALYIQDSWLDYGPAYAHSNLRWLLCGKGSGPLDLLRFPSLETLIATWWPSLSGAGDLNRLGQLVLYGYKPTSRDLAEFSRLRKNLKTMSFTSSSIKSLCGIEGIAALRRAAFSYCPQLIDVDSIKSLGPSLRELAFVNCPKAQAYAAVSAMIGLEFLSLSRVQPLRDIAFVSKMKKLRKLVLVNTRILSGDLRSAVPIPEVQFTAFPGYSHDPRSFGEAQAVLKSVGPARRTPQRSGRGRKA